MRVDVKFDKLKTSGYGEGTYKIYPRWWELWKNRQPKPFKVLGGDILMLVDEKGTIKDPALTFHLWKALHGEVEKMPKLQKVAP